MRLLLPIALLCASTLLPLSASAARDDFCYPKMQSYMVKPYQGCKTGYRMQSFAIDSKHTGYKCVLTAPDPCYERNKQRGKGKPPRTRSQ